MVDYPEQGEFVLATIKKILPYGAFCSLDEYSGVEGFLHVSEVSPGWVRNIRQYIKEEQKIVARIVHIDPEKEQIDLSLKRVSEAERKRKLEGYQQEKRAEKLLEIAAKKIGKTFKEALKEVGDALSSEYGALFPALEALSLGKFTGKLPKQWQEVLEAVSKEEIKQKKVTIRANLRLQSYSANGVEEVKSVLKKILERSQRGVDVDVHYLGAPNYFIDITAADYKKAEKSLSEIDALLKKSCTAELEYSLEKEK
jgi:translation initiation factor 2 subunit 1